MNSDSKRRHVISRDNLPAGILQLFNDKYPKGFNDLLPDLVKYSPGINPRTGKQIEPFYAVTLETDTDIYLVKIKVDIDNPEDVERWLEGEEEAEVEEVAGTTAAPDVNDTLPDDNISQYGGDDDSSDS
ncbi:MAG: hypothetical protein J1D85_06865 [Bacteroidales bacterium]|nr:hypothetical protein [Bacteroidales bacterium]